MPINARGFAAVCTLLSFMAAPGSTAAAPTETVLYSFKGGSDGFFPYHLTADSSGALYGVTGGGPISANCPGRPVGIGCGTVFKLTPPTASGGAWTKTLLYTFKGGRDGNNPIGPLVFDSSGALYGTTSIGGSSNCEFGCGTVYKLAPPPGGGTPWIKTTLYTFTGSTDGAFPYASVILDSSGALYGATNTGGTSSLSCFAPPFVGCGAVYKLTPPPGGGTPWMKTVLYSFTGAGDGSAPQEHLIFDGSGALYGTTFGAGGSGTPWGTVFKLTPPPSGGTPWIETTLYNFLSGAGAAGANPSSSLIFDSSGALYGTTESGGSSPSCDASVGCQGTVYKLLPPPGGGAPWTLTTLHTFTGGADGGFPAGSLVFDAVGALFGTAPFGGNSPSCKPSLGSCEGTVYKLTRPPGGGETWTETTLYTFTGGSDGGLPGGGLIADKAGYLYGSAQRGNPSCDIIYGCGVIFELAGTGFVANTPFSAFSSKLVIAPSHTYFELLSNVTLGTGAAYLDLPNQPVTVQVGAYSVTIPAGSFVKGSAYGEADFDGTVGGVKIHAKVWLTGTKQYLVLIKATGASMSGAANPVSVILTLGSNRGSALVTAAIYP